MRLKTKYLNLASLDAKMNEVKNEIPRVTKIAKMRLKMKYIILLTELLLLLKMKYLMLVI